MGRVLLVQNQQDCSFYRGTELGADRPRYAPRYQLKRSQSSARFLAGVGGYCLHLSGCRRRYEDFWLPLQKMQSCLRFLFLFHWLEHGACRHKHVVVLEAKP